MGCRFAFGEMFFCLLDWTVLSVFRGCPLETRVKELRERFLKDWFVLAGENLI